MALTLRPIPCLTDNYAWLLTESAHGEVAICDPGEAAPVLAALAPVGGRLDTILLTHHHADHVAGVAELVAKTGARVIGAAQDAHRLPPLDLALEPGDSFDIGGSPAIVLDTPGHTIGHVAFHFTLAGLVLCGDTLFAAGCGRLLEGTPAQMFGALAALAELPEATLVCCGHEYTEANLRFAATVEPENAALADFAARVKALRAAGKPSVPTSIGQEKTYNPFLRAPDVATLARLRAAKDSFR